MFNEFGFHKQVVDFPCWYDTGYVVITSHEHVFDHVIGIFVLNLHSLRKMSPIDPENVRCDLWHEVLNSET